MTNSLKLVLLLCTMCAASGPGSDALQNSQPPSATASFQGLPLDPLCDLLGIKDVGRVSATAKNYRAAITEIRSRYAKMAKQASTMDEFLHCAPFGQFRSKSAC